MAIAKPTAEVTIGSSLERTGEIALDPHEYIEIKTSTGERWTVKLDRIGMLEIRLVDAVGPRSNIAVRPHVANEISLQAVNF